MPRVLAWLSWLCLGTSALIASAALFAQWAVNAEAFGARDMGWALSMATLSAVAGVGSLYAVPVMVALGVLSLFFQRRAAIRFLVAVALTVLPLAAMTWLPRG
jgi:hypothetical protein